jgi:hypothetical protein
LRNSSPEGRGRSAATTGSGARDRRSRARGTPQIDPAREARALQRRCAQFSAPEAAAATSSAKADGRYLQRRCRDRARMTVSCGQRSEQRISRATHWKAVRPKLRNLEKILKNLTPAASHSSSQLRRLFQIGRAAQIRTTCPVDPIRVPSGSEHHALEIRFVPSRSESRKATNCARVPSRSECTSSFALQIRFANSLKERVLPWRSVYAYLQIRIRPDSAPKPKATDSGLPGRTNGFLNWITSW